MDTITLTFDDKSKKEYVKGIKLSEVLNQINNDNNTILCRYNGKKIDLETTLNKSGLLSLYDINSNIGNKIYERGLIYLFEECAINILGIDTKIVVKHSIDRGIFCKINKDITTDDITKIKKMMKEKVKENIPFIKIETTKEEAEAYFKSIKREDKLKTLFYINSNYVTLYKLEDTYNYIIGDLPYTTGPLKYFDLSLIKDKGVVVRYPSIYDNLKVLK